MRVQPLHMDYVMAAANLLAFVFGLRQSTNRSEVASMATKISVAEFVPTTDVKIAQTDDEYNANCRSVTIGTPLSHHILKPYLCQLVKCNVLF